MFSTGAENQYLAYRAKVTGCTTAAPLSALLQWRHGAKKTPGSPEEPLPEVFSPFRGAEKHLGSSGEDRTGLGTEPTEN